MSKEIKKISKRLKLLIAKCRSIFKCAIDRFMMSDALMLFKKYTFSPEVPIWW